MRMNEDIKLRFDKSDQENNINITRLEKYMNEQFIAGRDGISAVKR